METEYLKSLQLESLISLRLEYLIPLKDELLKRLEYGNGHEKKEEEYQSKIRNISISWDDRGWTTSNEYNADKNILIKEKLLDIRRDLNNDEGLYDLVSNLGKLKEDFKKIEAERENLVEPNGPTLPQQFYTKFSGKQNDADNNLKIFNANKELIVSNYTILSKIIQAIETLRDIYKDEDEKAKKKDEDEKAKKKDEDKDKVIGLEAAVVEVTGGRKQHKKKTRKYFKKNTKTKNTKTKNTKTKNTNRRFK